MQCMSVFWRQGPIASIIANQKWSRSPLIQLLRDSLNANASDPRDYTFALLGISNEAEETHLRPDYKEPVDQTYMRVAKYMVKNGYGPLLINSAPRRQKSVSPSWVPRWGEKDLALLMYIRGQSMHVSEIFRAAGQTVQKFQIKENMNILVVRGIVFDTIERLGSSQFLVRSVNDASHAVDEEERVLPCLYESLQMLGPTSSYPSGEMMSEVLCRPSVCDRPVEDRKASSEYIIGLQGFIAVMAGRVQQQLLEPRQRERTSSFQHQLAAITLALCLLKGNQPSDSIETRKLAYEFKAVAWRQFRRSIRCLTRKGYIGQVLEVGAVGDKIVIIQGCDVPYLLRPLGGNQYSLISDCYIHGIMYGQAWDETKVQNIEIL